MNRVKTRTSKTGEIVAYSEGAIRNNISAVEYCRTSMAAISGCAAGKLINFKLIEIGSVCNLQLSPRYFGTERNSWILILFSVGFRALVTGAGKVGHTVAQVFH